MNITQLRILRAVAECENYSRAAQQLFLSQPHVYVQMRNLEKELGCHLFDQVGRHAVLTEVGRALLEYATQILNLEDEAIQMVKDFKRLDKGQLTIWAGPMVADYILPPVMAAFKRRFPNIELKLQIVIHGAEISEKSLRLETDLVFLGTRSLPPYSVAERIWNSDLVVCVGPGHRLASHETISVDDLAGEVFVWYAFGGMASRMGEEALRKRGLEPATAMLMESPESVKGVVKGNYGITVLPRPVVDEDLRAGRLRALSIAGFFARYADFCYRHAMRRLSFPAEAFLQMAREASAGTAD
jgi:DNA-binding transcriptional LysR family regulator